MEELKNKRKFKKIRKKIFMYIVLVLILLYMIYAVYLLIKQPTNKVTVEHGTLYLEETDIGYIIRAEQVVKGENYKNGMEQIKNEGDKMAKGESIYRYYSKNEDELIKKITEMDNSIQETLKGQDSNLFSSDVKMLDNQLDEMIADLNQITDISKIAEYNKQIKNILIKKAKLTGENSSSGTYLKQLYNQRAKLEEELNSGAEYIYAPSSGIVSYKVDGLEEVLTPNNFSAINKVFLEGLKLKTGQLIATSDESGKVIDNSKCYIATISNSEQAKNAKLDDKVQIRLSNRKVVDAKIAYISKENEEDTIVILEIDKQIAELANYRKISFDLIWWSSVGLKVPNDAIVEENGLNYVVRNRAGYQNKIIVKVNRKNEKYSIVSNYDTEELKNLGFSEKEISSMKRISTEEVGRAPSASFF